MIPSTRRRALTVLVYRLGSSVATLGLPRSIRELNLRPSRPSLIARKAEEAGIMFGWVVLTLLVIVVLIPVTAIASTYVPSESRYQAIGDIATGLPVFTVSGVVLHDLRYLAVATGHAGRREGYEAPHGLGRWLLTSGDADLVVQALVTIAFVAIRLQVNPGSRLRSSPSPDLSGDLTRDLVEDTTPMQSDEWTQCVVRPSRVPIETTECERCATTSSSTPVQVGNLSNGAAIAAGADHSIAATNDGAAWD